MNRFLVFVSGSVISQVQDGNLGNNAMLDSEQERLFHYLVAKHNPKILHRLDSQPLNVTCTLTYQKLIGLVPR